MGLSFDTIIGRRLLRRGRRCELEPPLRRAPRPLPLLVAAFIAVSAAAGASRIADPPDTKQPTTSRVAPHIDGATFIADDGAELALRTWPATTGEPWAVLVALHGFNDYSNAFHLAAPYWAERGVTTYAFDQRGFGRSPDRGGWAGRERMADDLRVFVELVRARHPNATVGVAGESMGAAVAISAFASGRPPDADKIILLSPAVYGWSAQPLYQRIALWIAARTFSSTPLEPPQEVLVRHVASDNHEELTRMARDPLMIDAARPGTLAGLVDLMEHAGDRIGAIPRPVMMLYGRQDKIIPVRELDAAASQLKTSDTVIKYDRGWHLLLRDRQSRTVYRDVLAFLAR